MRSLVADIQFHCNTDNVNERKGKKVYGSESEYKHPLRSTETEGVINSMTEAKRVGLAIEREIPD